MTGKILYLEDTAVLNIILFDCFLDGKKCPACNNTIYHEKWNATPKLAEDRWAHKQAKQRELEEVVDFLGD